MLNGAVLAIEFTGMLELVVSVATKPDPVGVAELAMTVIGVEAVFGLIKKPPQDCLLQWLKMQSSRKCAG